MSGINPDESNSQYPDQQDQNYSQTFNHDQVGSGYPSAGQNYYYQYPQSQPIFAYAYQPQSQPGMYMGQPGMYMGQPGMYMGRPGMYMGQPGMYIGQSGMYMGQPGMQMGQRGVQMGQLGKQMGQLGVRMRQLSMQMGQPRYPASISNPRVANFGSCWRFQYPCTPVVYWVPTTATDAHLLSDRAIVAGYEAVDNSSLWSIRAKFKGALIPGKLVVKNNEAFVARRGKEHAVIEIEVCCGDPARCRWIASRGGLVPYNAVQGGYSSRGEPLYIGRACEQGSLIPGKVVPSHQALFLSYAGKAVAHTDYEVLAVY